MTKILLTIFALTLLLGCSQSEPLNIDKIREGFAKDAEIYNAKTLAWERVIDSLYGIADTNHLLSIKIIDHLLKTDTSIDRHKKSTLHFIKGDIFYSIDSSQNAIDEFTIAGQEYSMGGPRDLAARAGAYIKLKKFDKAIIDLTKAKDINHEYWWYIGNYYEIIGKRDSALFVYEHLYNIDSTFCKYSKERIIELKNPKTKPFTELIYKNRQRSVILIHGV